MKISKNSVCIRNTSTWANLKKEYKFDSVSFNPEKTLSRVNILSPKIDALMKKIQKLDEEDMKNHGKLFKHIIYSDVAGSYGAKMIASVFIASGFKLVYNNNLKMNSNFEKDKSFGLLTMSTVYKKPLPVGLNCFNSLPNLSKI